MSVEAQKETLGFQTEVKQLMHLVVHALYSNKEIFLRELVSNASDALDKLRFAALADNALYGDDSELKIQVSFDKDAKTITVRDNGIGMNRDEVMENIGTIAKSGTREFLSNLTGDQAKDSHLIGQFGVGFYSAFIVADKVVLKTRSAGAAADDAVRWESNGDGEYTIETMSKPQRGTEITLFLKEEETEFLDDWQLRSIITKYSDHINWPIVMKAIPQADDAEDSEKKPAQAEEETVNRATALWTLQKNEIKEEDYQELYKHISHDFNDALTWGHNHVEGKQHYISLLYIPKKAPYDMWNQEYKHGLKLYVKRVFIMDEAAQFLPRYLRFVKGVIDSSDLPLNISREILQDNKLVESIRAASVKRVLSMLEKLAKKDKEKYAEFWTEFGLVLKEGPIEDFANREQVAKLLRFASTHADTAEQNVSLDDYISRMKEGQDKIYYITGESFNAAKNSPHLEVFRKKGIEVLILSDRIDEWLVSHLSDYEGKHLASVSKGSLDLGKLDDEKADAEEKPVSDEVKTMCEQVKTVLGDIVKDVRTTDRLTNSPACLVADDHDMGREMERILKAAGQAIPSSKPIFEINPEHPLTAMLEKETDDQRFAEWAHILYDQAVLAEGGHLDNPAQFVQRLNKMLLELAQ